MLSSQSAVLCMMPDSLEVLGTIWRLNRPLQHLFRKAVRVLTHVFSLFAQRLPLCCNCLVTGQLKGVWGT